MKLFRHFNPAPAVHPGWRALLVSVVLLGWLAASSAAQDAAAGSFTASPESLLATIEADFRDTRGYIGHTALSPAVKQALLEVPRHQFIPEQWRTFAYENRPLPIGYGQTISQPYIVALMTELLNLQPGDRILEIGTGSGYQAAILATLVSEVYSVEIIAPLAASAEERLRRLGYANVVTRLGDGYYGWPDKAPFDGIIVTAAASQVPPPLIRQLREGGRMVIPVGGRFMTQQLLLIEKSQGGRINTRQMLPVRFVPLTGQH